MILDKFVRGYRDYLDDSELMTDIFPQSLSRYERLVVDRDTIRKLEGLDYNFKFLEENLEQIESEIDSLYDNMSSKLDRIQNLAEGYQKLNTRDLSGDILHDLQIYNLKASSLYDPISQALTLRRSVATKALKPHKVEVDGKDVLERFRLPQNRQNSSARVMVPDTSQTSLKRLVCVSRRGDELASSSLEYLTIPPDTYEIYVHSESMVGNKPFYTSLDVYSDVYEASTRIALEDKTITKGGNRLKVIVNKDVPLGCNLSYTLTVRQGSYLETLKPISGDVYDISKVPAGSLTVSITFDLEGSEDQTRTPKVYSVALYTI